MKTTFLVGLEAYGIFSVLHKGVDIWVGMGFDFLSFFT